MGDFIRARQRAFTALSPHADNARTFIPKRTSKAGPLFPTLVFPGDAGDTITTPDSGLNTFIGDIDGTFDVAFDTWTTGGGILIAKSDSAGDQRGWRFRVNASNLEFRYSTTGLDNIQVTSTLAHNLADRSRHTIRMTRDESTGDVTFFIDGVLFEVVSGPTGVMFSTIADVEVGGQNAGSSVLMTGRFYSGQVLDGIGGTIAVNIDAKDAALPSFVDPVTGATWTVNGNVELQG